MTLVSLTVADFPTTSGSLLLLHGVAPVTCVPACCRWTVASIPNFVVVLLVTLLYTSVQCTWRISCCRQAFFLFEISLLSLASLLSLQCCCCFAGVPAIVGVAAITDVLSASCISLFLHGSMLCADHPFFAGVPDVIGVAAVTI